MKRVVIGFLALVVAGLGASIWYWKNEKETSDCLAWSLEDTQWGLGSGTLPVQDGVANLSQATPLTFAVLSDARGTHLSNAFAERLSSEKLQFVAILGGISQDVTNLEGFLDSLPAGLPVWLMPGDLEIPAHLKKLTTKPNHVSAVHHLRTLKLNENIVIHAFPAIAHNSPRPTPGCTYSSKTGDQYLKNLSPAAIQIILGHQPPHFPNGTSDISTHTGLPIGDPRIPTWLQSPSLWIHGQTASSHQSPYSYKGDTSVGIGTPAIDKAPAGLLITVHSDDVEVSPI